MQNLQKVNILFLGGAKRVSLAERFISAGKKAGLDVSIFSYELDKLVPISAIGEVIIGLKWKDENLYDHLLQIIKEKQINIVLPFVDPATIVVSKLKKLAKNVFIPVSDEDKCATFFNKKTAQGWFLANNFPVPVYKNELPAIAKPVTGSASQGIIILKTQAQLDYFNENHQTENYLLQQFIDGEEYTVDCYISKQQKILANIPRKRIEITGGEVTKSITENNPEIIDLTKQILQKSGLTGPVNVQFLKEKSTGKLYIMEVNPRFGGGVITSIEAGADMPLMLLQELQGEEPKEVTSWKDKLVMMRANREFFTYATDN